jgi:hypothetical protein
VQITGSLAQVNSDLATLTDTDAAAGSDTISISATDSFGNNANPQTTAVTVSPLVPVLAAPGSVSIQGNTASIAGVNLSEANVR